MKRSNWLWIAAILGWNVVSSALAGAGVGPVAISIIMGAIIAGAIHIISSRGGFRQSPAVRNATTKVLDKTRGRTLMVALVCSAALIVTDSLVAHAIAAGVFLLYATYFTPALAALAVALFAMTTGGDLILLAAPLIVILARRDRWLRLDLSRSPMHAATTALFASVAFVFSLHFASMTLGRQRGTGASGVNKDGIVAALLQMLGVSTDPSSAGAPGRSVQVPSSPAANPPDDRSIPWLLLLAIALLLAAVVAFVIWWRRRTPKQPVPVSARPLARLEAVGNALGRPRAHNEGALSYAAALGERSGDARLPATGDLVSGRLYASQTTDPDRVEAQLHQLEQAPPTLPKVPLAERIAQAVRWTVAHWRGLAFSLGGLAALVLGGIAVAPHVGSFNDSPDLLAFDSNWSPHQETEPTPAEWFELMARPPRDLTRWESCSAATAEPSRTIRHHAAGLATLDGTLALQVAAFGMDSKPVLTLGTPEQYWQLLNTTAAANELPGEAAWRHDDWAIVPQNPFPTLEAVLDRLTPNDMVVTSEVDRFGDPFTRHESQPLNYNDDESSAEPYVPSPLLTTSYDYAWTVDVWLGADDVPIRVRTMVDDPDRTWHEWRRLPVSRVEISEPACPRTTADLIDGTDWVGAEEWKPSRPVPIRIHSTPDGFVYEADPWYDENDNVGAIATIGTIGGPLDRIGLDEYLTLYGAVILDGDEASGTTAAERLVVPLDWRDGATVTLVRFNHGPDATRLDRSGPTPASVARWGEVEPFDIWESFLTVTTEAGLEPMDPEEISVLVEPLWEGADLVVTDRSGNGHDDTYLVTQSWAEAVVRGYDEAGDLVSIAVVGDVSRWRTLGFEGRPPDAILQRETELQACLDGERNVDAAGYCE